MHEVPVTPGPKNVLLQNLDGPALTPVVQQTLPPVQSSLLSHSQTALPGATVSQLVSRASAPPLTWN